MDKGVLILSLVILVCSLSSAFASAGPAITIKQFTVDYPTEQSFRITIVAEASGGAAIGSFGLRTAKQVSAGEVLPGFSLRPNGYAYITAKDYPSSPEYLFDNGSRDEDPRNGVFVTTVSIEGWPVGEYGFVAYVCNRPAPGAYIGDLRTFSVRVEESKTGSTIISSPRPIKRNAKDAQDVVIYKQEGIYACFPNLIQLDGTTLVTTFGTRVRASHIDPTGGSKTMISRDGGLTWQVTNEQIIDPKWRGKSADGKLEYLTYAYAQGWQYVDASQKDELLAQGKLVMDVREGVVAYLGGRAFSKISLNGGVTWLQEEIETPSWSGLGLMGYHSAASYLVTSKGVRLIAIYGRKDGRSPDEVFLLRSANNGLTWEFRSLAGVTPEGLGFNETALVETPQGEILAMMRSQPEGYLYQCRSTDDGLTWTKPEKTPIWGYPAHLLVLKNGDILCTYGYRRPPMGVRACISHDGGKSWDVANEIIIRADSTGSPGDVGYPISTQLSDGDIFTIYYITLGDGITHVAGTRWKVE